MLSLILLLALTYLMGAIPVAYIYCKMKGKDITREGSGNVGATNAARLYGKQAFFIIFFLDALKGYLPVALLTPLLTPESFSINAVRIMVFCMALIGHVWSVFIRFKGGKGVSTSLGGLLALMPAPSLAAAGVFGLVFAFSRIVSISSMVAALSLPLWVKLFHYPSLLIYFSLFLAFFIVFTHRSNLKRLVAGTEKQLKKEA